VLAVVVLGVVVAGAGAWAARGAFREWWLLRQAETGTAEEQQAAIAQLVEMGSETVVPVLVRRLRRIVSETDNSPFYLPFAVEQSFDGDESFAATAWKAEPARVFDPDVMGTLDSLMSIEPLGVAALVVLLSADDTRVANAAGWVLGRAPKEFARDIARIFAEGHAGASERAAGVLFTMRERRAPALEFILKALADADSWERRALAARLLAVQDGSDNIDALIGALDDEHVGVRIAAMSALSTYGERASRAARAVAVHLEDSNATARFFAVYTLGEIGVDASFALPKLRDLSRADPTLWVSDYARTAIEKITGDFD
jgi:HEAT repeat protein